MTRLEDITKNSAVRGILPNVTVKIIDAQPFGSGALKIVYETPEGATDQEILYRDREPTLELVETGRPWSFTGDGELLRLTSEALRIQLAYLFDPVLAVHTSMVEPLPHQITAVYEEMLTRQPLRFLLADDPGAGKTIMAGLLIKELIVRGDLKRCMIVAPGNLVEQWQDELSEKFQLPFDIMTNDKFESAYSGNWFTENDLVVCRLDKLSRSEAVQDKLQVTDWDLIVVDEAHKMSASLFGNEVKETQRHKLGRRLSTLTRHFLLMSATPHNGKEEDFQLFMRLLDADRFEGAFRPGVHTCDATDMMRRMVKEDLLRFDETRLFPERRAYTVNYELSREEAHLYSAVSDYVRQEFDRAKALQNEGRQGTVGFALTILQRRLASSPEAIYQSLRRRRERLEGRRSEIQLMKRGASERLNFNDALPSLSEPDDIEDFEDRPGDEFEAAEESILDQATAAQTIAELELEIESLRQLETLAQQVRSSGKDRKWEELSSLLQDNEHMFDEHGNRRKLVIFTEHRDTLNYLHSRITTLLGYPESVVTISGGMLREQRKDAQDRFTHDKETLVLLATDAAGEGINLQQAHLMVNYDLPWNPNRLEQRFGRIHRIGQTNVCHLWNLVAGETREGDVFRRLLEKLEVERDALGGAVFDVLGQAIEGRQLRELLQEAIFYGSQPEVRARLKERVEGALDHSRLQALIESQSLERETMDTSRVRQIRDEMERANARRLQPHFIAAFFHEAFAHLGGKLRERESKRYEISHVPAEIRNRDRQIGTRNTLQKKYERITFEKNLVNLEGQRQAAFVCPGHPLLDSTIDLILEKYRDLLKQGAVLVDETDAGEAARALFYLEHSIHDARPNPRGGRHVVSRQLQFVSIDSGGSVSAAGYAPYLDYRAATEEETKQLQPLLDEEWLKQDLEERAVAHAISELVPRHVQEVRGRKEELIEKTISAVTERLTKEYMHWDNRAQQLKAQEEAGRTPKLNSRKAEQRADELQGRLQKRLEELEQEKQLSPKAPFAIGGALVVPIGLLRRLQGNPVAEPAHAKETKRIEMLAMKAVMDAERQLGHDPRDVSEAKCGYDVESTDGQTKLLRFLEVKGRVAGADTVTITRNEIVTGINTASSYILAVVQVDGDVVHPPVYVRKPFEREPDFDVTSVNYNLRDLLAKGQPPT
ncbi:helicase-related protein [Botrimarina mediterranea]|uniref:RNA polymerase-associated protein RapA n=1 Tax=Botrimarina mediterranea TaxID=2528022 RepID=A0A518K7N6_9BACT|nr:helicase-related protein [Botrimarina mediterranea]QDV73809.1 RNA polymerase-associated protein RapA [Botrimarina mediterranea]